MAHNKHSRNLIKLIRRFFIPGNSFWGAEIGVWKGHNAAMLLEAFPSLLLYCVDPWDAGGDHVSMPDVDPEMFAAAKAEFLRLTDRYHDRRHVLPFTSNEASRVVKDDARLTFVFIDGDHTYESVWRDLHLWYPKLRNGGLMSGHDYNWKDAETGDLVVRQAVDEFARDHGYKVGVVPGQVWWFLKK